MYLKLTYPLQKGAWYATAHAETGAALQDATPINPVAMEREHRMTQLVQTVAVALSVLWSEGVVSAAQYTFTPLAVPAFGVTQTKHGQNILYLFGELS
jgi:hypothetical protein